MSKFLIYKSSAGSGKTTALIRTFLGLSLSNPSPDAFKRILAITFTNKATTEMKERLISELEKLSNLSVNEMAEDFMTKSLIEDTGLTATELKIRAWRSFQLLLHDYGDLAISTIDQFNHRLIRAFSRELNLRADFEVELDEKNLFHEAVVRLVDRVGKDEHLTKHLVGYVAHMLDEDKKVNLVSKLEELRPLILSEEAHAPIAALREIDRSIFPPLIKTLRKATRQYEADLIACSKKFFEYLDVKGIDLQHLAGKSNGWSSYFKKMNNFIGKKIEPTDTQKKLTSGVWAHPKVKPDIKAIIEGASSELDALLEEAKNLNEAGFGTYTLQKTILNQIDLIAVITDLNGFLDEIRLERNILPISYFNRIVSEALRQEPVAFLYESFGNRFNHILIDEFQDTSSLQWLNLLPLFEETLSRGLTSLVVGDAKQSIYRWRGGRAEQLISLPEISIGGHQFDEATQDSLIRNARIENLNTNYRSLRNVIDFNNIIFSRLGAILTANESIFRKEYATEHVSQLIPNAKSGGYVEMRYLGKGAEREDHWDQLLLQISTALKSGFTYGDMAILVRSSTKEGKEIVSFLKHHDIPVVTSDSYEIDQHLEVKLVIALMRIGENRNLVPPKLTAMRCLCTLLNIEYAPHRYSQNKNINLEAFLRDNGLPDLKQSWFAAGAWQVCESLIAAYLPEQKSNAYLNALQNSIVKKGGMAITAGEFLTWWDTLKEKPSATEGGSKNAIQLLTIHKSKGLQFKVCFIPFVNWALTVGRNERWFPLSGPIAESLPYAPLPLTSKLPDMGFAEESEKESGSIQFDNLNLIYVAFTRAVEQLYICFTHSNKSYIGESVLKACDGLESAAVGGTPVKKLSLQENGEAGQLKPGEEDPFIIQMGEPIRVQPPKTSTHDMSVLENAHYSDQMWFDRFDLAYDPNAYGSDLSRKTGLVFHRIAAETNTATEALEETQRLLKDGFIDEPEKKEIDHMLTVLYADEKYEEMSLNARKFAERDLIYNGAILRPDLVLEQADKAIVIDFKTGDEKEEQHFQQVQHYMEAAEAILGKPTSGFVFYITQPKWTEVPARKVASGGQTTLF